MKQYCHKDEDCAYEHVCYKRYCMGTWHACGRADVPFCLGYKRKWWKFWVN